MKVNVDRVSGQIEKQYQLRVDQGVLIVMGSKVYVSDVRPSSEQEEEEMRERVYLLHCSCYNTDCS